MTSPWVLYSRPFFLFPPFLFPSSLRQSKTVLFDLCSWFRFLYSRHVYDPLPYFSPTSPPFPFTTSPTPFPFAPFLSSPPLFYPIILYSTLHSTLFTRGPLRSTLSCIRRFSGLLEEGEEEEGRVRGRRGRGRGKECGGGAG